MVVCQTLLAYCLSLVLVLYSLFNVITTKNVAFLVLSRFQLNDDSDVRIFAGSGQVLQGQIKNMASPFYAL